MNELFFLTSLQSRSFYPPLSGGRLHEGRPIRGRVLWLGARFLGLTEGKVLLDGPNLGSVDQSGLAQSALALAGLLLENVTLTLLATQDLARTGYLETLGNCLTCLINTTFAGHGARIIHASPALARKISVKW